MFEKGHSCKGCPFLLPLIYAFKSLALKQIPSIQLINLSYTLLSI